MPFFATALTNKMVILTIYFLQCIDDILMQIYYIYSKAPKTCRDLEVIITELKCCFDSFEFPIEGSNRPLRACGIPYNSEYFSASVCSER